jgi:regulatory protein
MKVVKIAKKDQKNVAVHFDNDEVIFLSVDVFLKSSLKRDDEVPDDRLSSIIRENRLFHIKQRAFRFLARRLHSTSELRTKLLQKGYDRNLIDVVLDDLKLNKYLDDTEFARMFVDEKIKIKLWGEKKLRAELIKKGINSNILSNVLNEAISDEDNLKNAFMTAEKKYRALLNRGLNKENIKNKLITFLSSRGFNYDVIKEVCGRLINDDD